MSNLTLGSLFDGSGGFLLGGALNGIKPLWKSDIEPFPIAVTNKRFPEVKHYGDINQIDGAEVPPVDIITGGFCCQDLSVAGKRAGIHGERSGLFFQIVRIIKEMRVATGNAYPKFAVLENVPGMYSSSGGSDFLEVLNELVKIKTEGLSPNETLSVPMPSDGKWSTSGEIVGDGFSLGWRTLDAQFWGVAQRRRRCYIVVDFTGERAGEILFDETRLSGDSQTGGAARQGTAGGLAAGSGSAVNVLNDQGGAFMDLSEDVTGTLRSQEHGHAPIVFEPGAASRVGGHVWENLTGALRADAGDNQAAVVIENHPADSRVKIAEDGIVQTLPSRMGTGGGNVPLVMNERQYALTVGEDVANTLTGTDYKGPQCVFESAAFMGGQGAKARSIAYHENTSPTLRSEAGGNSVPMAVYGICSKSSNSMKSANPHSGFYEAKTARTLDTSVPDPNKNAGGMAVVALEGNGSRPSHHGDGFSDEDVAYTLNSVERHAVCYQDKVGALCASDYKFPQQQQVEEGKAIVERQVFGNNGHGRYNDKPATLKASGGDYPGGENVVVENRYVVRRLTPTECALLQGFPPDWCAGLETAEPTEEDIAFWTEVWETRRNIVGTSSKPKSRNQIVKWLQDPHSDSAEYKMWGNGVALPCVVFVLGGIVYSSQQ
ncbi:DNA methyltransferase [Clostridia bacterium]|nr:DNA methyltransferase [Clostridia bacterium]